LKKNPHSRPVFKGVYARNRLPRLLNVPSALVGNTDPNHRMGQQWFAIYIDANSRGEYYDPTGRPPHESAYANFMNKHCLHWTYNTVRVRTSLHFLPHSSMCRTKHDRRHQALRKSRRSDDHCTECCAVT
jgi:hypothetical protein